MEIQYMVKIRDDIAKKSEVEKEWDHIAKKFEVEKEWEEIAEKRKEVMSILLDKAKELEEMELKLASRIRNKMKTCIRGILPEQNTNNFDQPIEIMDDEEVPVKQPKLPEDARSLEELNTSQEITWGEKSNRRCLRWRSDLTSPQPSSFEEFFKYLCRSLNPNPPHELNFTNNEKVECAKASLVDFNSKHPDTPYTFVEMVSALHISFRGGRSNHGNFTARPLDGFGDSSCPRLFFTCANPERDGGYSVDCCILLDADLSSREEARVSDSGTATGTVKRRGLPRFFINGGVVHPTDETIEAVTFSRPWHWSCSGCSHYYY